MNTKIVYAAGIVIIIIGIIFYFSTYVYNSPTNESTGPETQTIQSTSDLSGSSNPSPQNNNNNNNGNLGQQQAPPSTTPSNYQNLSLSINSVEIVPSNNDNNNNVSNLQIAMDVYNPNRGSAILETLSYNVFLDDVRLSSGDMGTRTEGFVDSLESVYTIIGNQTITLRDKTPLTDQGRSLLDSGLSVAPVSGNNLSSQPSQSLTTNASNGTNTTTTLPPDSKSDSYLVNGTYFFTLNRGSQAQSSEYPFSLQFPAK